jgi:AcrR family transcriptional regulator
MTETPTPERVALARRRYLEDAPVRAICAEAGFSLGTLYRCLAGHFPDGSGIAPAAIALRSTGTRPPRRKSGRAALVARMWRTAERQVEEIEQRLKAAGLELTERESNARTLAIVAKTLRELVSLDHANNAGAKEAVKDNDATAVPRNVDELRRALARKLDAFVAGRAARVPGDPQ